MARWGYAARAVVYGLVGIFAIRLTFQEGGALTDSHGILIHVLKQPFGKIILIAVAVGLLFFAIWRALQSIKDYEHKGTDFKGIAIRIGYGISSITYAVLGYHAINLIFHLSQSSNQSSEKKIAQTLIGQSYGSLLLGLVALIIIVYGLVQFYVAFKEKFKKHLDLPRSRRWLLSICKVGISARGIVLCLMGWFFLRAAFYTNSNEAEGLKGIWKFLAAQSYGTILVAAVAIGLMAFSVYGFTEAIYRRRSYS